MLLPPTGQVSGRRLLLAHLTPLSAAFVAALFAGRGWTTWDGTTPLFLLAALICLMAAVSVFLQLLVRYSLDPDLRRLCVLGIARELLGWHLDPADLDPADLDQPSTSPGAPGEGGGRS